MTKNQFMTLKPGDKVRCSCGACGHKIWKVVKRLDPTLILATNEIGNTGTLSCGVLLERVE